MLALGVLAGGGGVPALAAPGSTVGSNVADCAGKPDAMGVSRVVVIDPNDGPYYGLETKQPRKPSFLRQKEIVLTFDDGPMPWITKSILQTLDDFCVKATFFSIGEMAQHYPEWINKELARGHTVGTHSWSHPLPFNKLTEEAQQDQIERGFAAVSNAARTPIAPFFRFPGLGDSPETLAYLRSRHIATFTVDVVSNDSYTAEPEKLTQQTLEKVEARTWGSIILFHDIKASTAKALPNILRGLKERGYRIVHMTSKTPYQPNPAYAGKLRPLPARVASGGPASAAGTSLPFYGAVKPGYAQGLPWAPKGTERGFDSSAPNGTKPLRAATGAQPATVQKRPAKPAPSSSTSSGGWLTTIFPDSSPPPAKKPPKPKKPVEVSNAVDAGLSAGLGAGRP